MDYARPVPSRPRLALLTRAAGLALVMLLAACGFQMRGVTPMPFKTMYVGLPDNSRFGADVRRSIRAASPDTRLVATPKEAEVTLQQVADNRTLRDVSLNAQGRVEEYELGIQFTFRLIDAKGNALIPDTTLSAYRQMPYDDQVMQAKEDQIRVLYEDMQQSLVSRLIRRLTAPDVRQAAARPRGTGDLDEPVYDPNEAMGTTGQDTPTPWRSPTITTPGMLRY